MLTKEYYTKINGGFNEIHGDFERDWVNGNLWRLCDSSDYAIKQQEEIFDAVASFKIFDAGASFEMVKKV